MVARGRQKKPSGLRRTWRFYRPYVAAHHGELLAGSLAALGMVGARLALPWPLTQIVVPWIEARSDEAGAATLASPEILTAGFVFFVLYTLLGAFDLRSRVRFADFSIATVGDVRVAAFDALLEVEREEAVSGDLLTRMIGDTARLKEGTRGFLVHTVTNGALFLGIVVMLAWVDPVFAVIMGAGLIAISLVTARACQIIHRRARELREKEARLADDILHVARSNVSGAAPRLPKRSLEASLTRMQGLTAIAVYVIFGVVIALCFNAAAARTETHAQLFLLSSYTLILVHPVVRLSRQGTRLGKMLACAEGIERAIRAMRRNPAKGHLEALRDGLRFEGLTLGGSGNRKSPRIGPLDFTLRPGERVAVVGPVGSGKSSLLHAIARRRRPDSGRVLWDSTDLAAVSRRMRKQQIVNAPESPPGRSWTVGARLEDRPTALAAASTLIERLGDPLGSHDLSHTEARVLAVETALRQPLAVFLVDDAVRGLGPRDARRFLEEILAARPEALTIVALSRLEPLHLFERVLALDRGRVVFDGSPSEYDCLDGSPAVRASRPEVPPTHEES